MLEDIIAQRIKKLDILKKAGINPYPSNVKRTHSINEVKSKFSYFVRSKKKVSLAGRIMSIRDQGGLVFVDLKDGSGEIQGVLKKNKTLNFQFAKSIIDIGDFISISGILFKTKKGEKSIGAEELDILSKSIRPIPDNWYGLEDTELKLRMRYLDMLFNQDVKEMFKKKAVFWKTIREFLDKEGFLEVDTPVLESVPGGADAEPFKTHHNALNTDFYLRISLEIPLKKLLIAGFERVFEIGKIFRNEGIDREHLQDYMQLEFYWAYHNYKDLMDLTERMYKKVIKRVCGSFTTVYNGNKINWGGKWEKVDYVEVFKEENKIDPIIGSRDDLFKLAESLGLRPDNRLGKGRLIDLIFKKTVRPKLINPVFLIHTPVIISPLAKRLEENPSKAERVQILAGGTELGNGWSELNDPVDQYERFKEQMRLRKRGDKEAQRLDREFITAMEYGMPPAAGFGLSERFFAVLMDKPIRETVIYPLMKQRK